MTAPLTETISDSELDAWLHHEIEKPCEVWTNCRSHQCGLPAEYLGYSKCSKHGTEHNFLCTGHYRRTSEGLWCSFCSTPVVFTWIERIK